MSKNFLEFCNDFKSNLYNELNNDKTEKLEVLINKYSAKFVEEYVKQDYIDKGIYINPNMLNFHSVALVEGWIKEYFNKD